MPRNIKRGDTYPNITGTVSDADGPVPIGAANLVRLILSNGVDVLEWDCLVTDPDAVRGDPDCGKFYYVLQEGDTDVAADWNAEVEVIWSAGVKQTFPNTGNDIVYVNADLNNG